MLICHGKTKVALLKSKFSILRLELLGVFIVSRLTAKIHQSFCGVKVKVYCHDNRTEKCKGSNVLFIYTVTKAVYIYILASHRTLWQLASSNREVSVLKF